MKKQHIDRCSDGNPQLSPHHLKGQKYSHHQRKDVQEEYLFPSKLQRQNFSYPDNLRGSAENYSRHKYDVLHRPANEEPIMKKVYSEGYFDVKGLKESHRQNHKETQRSDHSCDKKETLFIEDRAGKGQYDPVNYPNKLIRHSEMDQYSSRKPGTPKFQIENSSEPKYENKSKIRGKIANSKDGSWNSRRRRPIDEDENSDDSEEQVHGQRQSIEVHYYDGDFNKPGPSRIHSSQRVPMVQEPFPPNSDEVDATFICARTQRTSARLEDGIAQMMDRYQNGKSLTMRNARKIAKDLGVLQQLDDELCNENGTLVNEEFNEYSYKPGTQRKCWARGCWSRNRHSHAKGCGKDLDSTESTWTRGQKIPGSLKRTAKWEIQQQKTKAMIRETYEDIFSKWNVWSSSLKIIEGQYGTGVVSFFIFLRWLLFLNLFIFFVVLFFIILPQTLFHLVSNETERETLVTANDFTSTNSPLIYEILTLRQNFSTTCHNNYSQQVKDAEKGGIAYIQDFLQGTGWLELTLMFIGYYTSSKLRIFSSKLQYNMPVAFLLVTLGYFLFCLAKMLNYANRGVHETLLANEGYANNYCNMVFTNWDFCIQYKKAAKLKHHSIFQELRSQLAEEMHKVKKSEWSTVKKITIYSIRLVANIAVVGVLVGSFYLIKYVAEISLKETQASYSSGSFGSLVFQYLPSFTITILNIILPIIFSKLIVFEEYSKEFEIQLSLIRSVFIRLASIGILVASFYNLIYCNDDNLTICLQGMNDKGCNRPICWETYVGQQVYKLVIMDIFVVIITTFLVETPRRLFVTHYKNKLTNFIGHQEFDIPSQVLAMVYSQGLCWLGTFYSPMIPAVYVINLVLLFYVKKFTLLKNCEPSNTAYKASRSNTFFMVVLMLTFIVTASILGYSISDVQPSFGCGPFRLYDSMMTSVAEVINNWPVPKTILNIVFSATFEVPVFVLLCFAIYYYITLASAHTNMAKVLKDQLLLDGKDKQFLLSQVNDAAHKLKKT